MLAQILSVLIGVAKASFLKDLGFSYMEQMLHRSAYNKHILNLGTNFIEFVNNLDYLHSFIAQKTEV